MFFGAVLLFIPVAFNVASKFRYTACILNPSLAAQASGSPFTREKGLAASHYTEPMLTLGSSVHIEFGLIHRYNSVCRFYDTAPNLDFS